MKYFTIADLAKLSGIRAHTLRIWERRFSIVTPERSSGNFRYYQLEHVIHLLRISLLRKAGYKISALAGMDQKLVEKKWMELSREAHQHERVVHQLMRSMYSGDIDGFEAHLDNALNRWGIDQTLKNIILPFLDKGQFFSCRNCSIDEDFATTILRKKIIVGIESVHPILYTGKTALLFLPEGEYFDLLLLSFHYLVKCLGLKVWYMGTNISIEKLEKVVDTKQPDFLFTYLAPKKEHQQNALLSSMNKSGTVKSFILHLDQKLTPHFSSRSGRYHYIEAMQLLPELIGDDIS